MPSVPKVGGAIAKVENVKKKKKGKNNPSCDVRIPGNNKHIFEMYLYLTFANLSFMLNKFNWAHAILKISCVNVVSRIPKEIEQNYGKNVILSHEVKRETSKIPGFIEEEKIQESIW